MIRSTSTLVRLLSIVFLSFILVQNAFAQSSNTSDKTTIKDKAKAVTDPVITETPAPVVKTGVIASTAQNKSKGSVAVGAIIDEQESFGEKVAITGGVSNNSGNCKATIHNSNEETDFRVRFKVKGMSEGRRIFSKSFSGKVKKASKFSKQFTCNEEAVLQLELVSAKPLK